MSLASLASLGSLLSLLSFSGQLSWTGVPPALPVGTALALPLREQFLLEFLVCGWGGEGTNRETT